MSDPKELEVAVARTITANFHHRHVPLDLARAILASGVLDEVKADAWDEGWDARDDYPYKEGNPYRKEGAAR